MPFSTQGADSAREAVICLLAEAHNCGDRATAIAQTRRAQEKCRALIAENSGDGFCLMAETWAELAVEAQLPSERYSQWMECLSIASRGLRKLGEVTILSLYVDKVIDFLQDPNIVVPIKEVNSLLALVTRTIDTFLDRKESSGRSGLLARKSAVLRCASRYKVARADQMKYSESAIRCAQKAVELEESSWVAHLEFGNAQWHIAQFDRGDKAFHVRIRQAEASYWRSVGLRATVYNTLAICRFFRNTYQTSPSLESFGRYRLLEVNRRRLLRQAYLYAEAVLQLWYAKVPSDVLDFYLEEAESLLEGSLGAGYAEARNVLGLAFLKAIKGELVVAEEILQTLHSLAKGTPWTKIAEIVCASQSAEDLITRGFALGVADSATWNRLGTFANDFLGDRRLASSMYRVAIRLKPSNAVALTNLAARLLDENTVDATREAARWISRAASCADRRYRWWRNVKQKIDERIEGGATGGTVSLAKRRPIRTAMNTADILRNYRVLKGMDNVQERGYLFEKLVKNLLDIHCGNSFASYRTAAGVEGGLRHQVDAAFSFFEPAYYRVETKWTSCPATPDDIQLFIGKLDTVGVKGLFISVAGFTAEAVQLACACRKEYQVLLMDGEELDATLQGSPSFDEAIRVKQLCFARKGDPYFRIVPARQDETDLQGEMAMTGAPPP